MKRRFVHLHGHSQYSLQDGASRIDKLVGAVVANGMDAVALTDHGVMYGSLEFYKEAQKKGIKPIIGCEAYICKNRNEKVGGNKKDHENRTYHLVLLAENKKGYLNLLKMVSEANTRGFYSKPRIDHGLLYECREGIIALSACLGGEVSQHLLKGDYERAKAIAIYYDQLMGRGNYFLEMQDHGIELQRQVNDMLRRISVETGIPLVVTNDYHYVEHGHHKHHCAHVCSGQRKTVNDPTAYEAYSTKQFYIKSPEEMWAIFPNDPEALLNTVRIADRCNVLVEMGKYILPDFPVPEGYTESSYMRKLAWEGLAIRGLDQDPACRERLTYELDMIDQMGFPGYFLIVQDFINWARGKDIPVGPGRGSCAGSLAAYCLQITDIEPLKYDLLFERFLNPDRISMPDIDTDFCIERRGEVIQYVQDKYGADKVSGIGAIGTLAVKASIKDVGRVFGFDFQTMNRVSKLVPDGPNHTWDDPDVAGEGSELMKVCKNDPRLMEVVELAKELGPRRKDGKETKGIARNISKHAAGVIIGSDPLETCVPLFFDRKSASTIPNTQWDMVWSEKLGLVKMDFLGLRNLTVMRKARDIIHQSTGAWIDLRTLPLDDPKVYDLFKAGDLLGIFQVEGEGISEVAQQIAPTNMEEIGAILALYRPGPMDSGAMQEYIDRKAGRKSVSYDHPDLEPILKKTYGCMIYQEQVMQTAVAIAGYTMPMADNLRKVMGKKDMNKIAEECDRFVKGAVAKGHDETWAKKLADDISKFARYGFNKCLMGDTLIRDTEGNVRTIREMWETPPPKGTKLHSVTPEGQVVENDFIEAFPTGKRKVVRVKTRDGRVVECTPDHKFLTPDGTYKTIAEIGVGGQIVAAKLD